MNSNETVFNDATIVGYSGPAGAKVFFRGKNDAVIFLSIGTLHEFSRDEFDELAGLAVTASAKLCAIDGSCSSGALAGGVSDRKRSIFLLQNGDVKVNFLQLSKVFTNKTFISFASALETASQNLKTYKRRSVEKEKALEPWKEKRSNLSGRDMFYRSVFLVLAILTLADVFLLITGIFNPAVFFAVLILTPVVILLFLILPKGDRANLSQNTRKYLDEDLLTHISRLNFSKKTVEFFVVLFLALFFMTVYFSKAFPLVYNFWKDYFGGK